MFIAILAVLLRDVLPCGAAPNLPDGVPIYSVSACKIGTAPVRARPDGSHIGFGELGAGDSFAHGPVRVDAARASADPSLARLIGHVLGVGPQKEVRRIAAQGIVATVADAQPRRNVAMRQDPSDAMRLQDPAVFAAFPDVPIEQGASRAMSGGPSPRPAFRLAATVDLLPEPIRKASWAHAAEYSKESAA